MPTERLQTEVSGRRAKDGAAKRTFGPLGSDAWKPPDVGRLLIAQEVQLPGEVEELDPRHVRVWGGPAVGFTEELDELSGGHRRESLTCALNATVLRVIQKPPKGLPMDLADADRTANANDAAPFGYAHALFHRLHDITDLQLEPAKAARDVLFSGADLVKGQHETHVGHRVKTGNEE